ncbi:aldo/keto reductase [Globicatella sp. PHS-GS-PNBC-21-1553]|uniref:aldo/keto reductase n=1 Tax=Globicatella sp. PHS-GS-PNBC-21-1553 TaxID=2885764 RepID=UPI00298ED690|nr:aldo/keto reductase [Globicatella sp. PHS-GS-PNBC-21-1553]
MPFETALELIEQLDWVKEGRGGLAQAALKWILQQEAVTTVIPGFKNPKQVTQNLASLSVPDFSAEELNRLSEFYWEKVHQHIRGTY